MVLALPSLSNDPEALLFHAILNGDLAKVCQLIDAGADKTSILHYPSQWEGSSVLSMAAYQGHISVVQYLVKTAGVPVNFKDPCLGRTALHWACMADRVDIVTYLLSLGASIDEPDRKEVTPVMYAAMNRSIATALVLLEHGCCLDHTDSLQSSALHYATFYCDKDLVTALIKGGCIVNTVSVFGRGTPLANLVFHKDAYNCQLLLEAGYDLRNETWVSELLDKEKTQLSAAETIVLRRWKNPPPLQGICRKLLRENLLGPNWSYKFNAIGIPRSLQNFLLFKNV